MKNKWMLLLFVIFVFGCQNKENTNNINKANRISENKKDEKNKAGNNYVKKENEEKMIEEKIEETPEMIEQKMLQNLNAANFEYVDFLRGYKFLGKNIVFLMDEETNKKNIMAHVPENTVVEKLNLIGSFNGWETNSENFKMGLFKDKKTWYIIKKRDEINIPGNSGNPEFAFYLEGKFKKSNGMEYPTEAYIKPLEELEIGYKFTDQFTGNYNYLVINEFDDIEIIKKNHFKAIEIKKEFKNDEELSNFRSVKIGEIKDKKLYRSYHPFTRSRTYKIEEKRIKKVQDLIKKNKIKSVINLTDTEDVKKNKNVPAYYKDLIKKNNVLFVRTDYNTVYYKTDKPEFEEMLAEVLKFITKKEPPYMIHCMLGTDRTGVVTAFIAGFMGASWKEIAADYEKSNDSGMGEFRDKRLLKYSFENALGVDPEKDENLRWTIRKYFKEKIKLSEKELYYLADKLSNQ